MESTPLSELFKRKLPNFDIQTRLRSWAPLTQHENSLVSEVIHEAEQQLLHLEDRIPELQQEQDMLRRDLHGYTSLLAPIRSLPHEVLSEILGLCSTTKISYVDFPVFPESDSDEDSFVNPLARPVFEGRISFKVPATKLSKVCIAWNNILISPSLWSSIDLDLRVPKAQLDGNSIAKMSAVMAEVLARSGNHPLRIGIRYQDPRASEIAIQFNSYFDIMRTLLDTCQRWKTAKLAIECAADTIRDSFHYFTRPMSHLQFLSLTLLPKVGERYEWNSEPYSQPQCWSTHFLDTPKLSHVMVNEATFAAVDLLWSKLSILQVGMGEPSRQPISQDRTNQVLGQCSALTSLVWSSLSDSPMISGVQPDESISLPIKRLSLAGSRRELISSFQYPALVDLDMMYRGFDTSEWNFFVLPSVRATLQSLRMSICSCRPESFNPVEKFWEDMGEFPALESLSIEHAEFQCGDAPFDFSLICHQFPKMKMLSCSFWPSNSFEDIHRFEPRRLEYTLALLNPFIEPIRSTLERVHVALPGVTEHSREFGHLEEAGLVVELRDSDLEEHNISTYSDSD